MLTQLIPQYLKSHRRLNIPGVGAFIVKDSQEEILFSELIKRDDGVLRALLAEQGVREIEAAAVIDRFIFELKHETEEVGGEFVIKGFGTLRREEGGRLIFVVGSEGSKEQSEECSTEDNTHSVENTTSEESTPSKESIPEVERLTPETPAPSPETSPQPHSTSEPPSKYTSEKIRELYGAPQNFRERERDPDVEDLTYSQRQKSMAGYTLVNNDSKRRGVDKVLLFGIVAAVIAIFVIAYGFYVGYIMDGNIEIEWPW